MSPQSSFLTQRFILMPGNTKGWCVRRDGLGVSNGVYNCFVGSTKNSTNYTNFRSGVKKFGNEW